MQKQLQSQQKSVLITVGTTNFDSLIQNLDQSEIYSSLQKHGFNSIIFQYGNGQQKPKNYEHFSSIKVDCFDYTQNLIEYIKNADLIISHCGAGTILECLKQNKIMIGVVNTSLMNNHQIELFDGIVKRNYAYGIDDPQKINQKTIEDILTKYDQKIDIVPYPTPEVNAFENIIISLYN